MNLVRPAALAKALFMLGPESIHGPKHWVQVATNGATLARCTPGSDALVVKWFAWLHDCARRDDGRDPKHGLRAARTLVALDRSGFKMLSGQQMELLFWAIESHSDGCTTNDPTVGVCWDADRLDLVRCGVVPSVHLMSTMEGKRRALELDKRPFKSSGLDARGKIIC